MVGGHPRCPHLSEYINQANLLHIRKNFNQAFVNDFIPSDLTNFFASFVEILNDEILAAVTCLIHGHSTAHVVKEGMVQFPAYF